jgi:hypothetical protein
MAGFWLVAVVLFLLLFVSGAASPQLATTAAERLRFGQS